MNDFHTDVVIVGGGLVGLVLANALVKTGFSVAIIEKKLFKFDEKKSADGWVSALTQGSVSLLEQLNLLQNISSESVSSLQALKVWDVTGGGKIEFESAELGVKELGVILENQALLKSAFEKLKSNSSVSFLQETPRSLTHTAEGVGLQLESGIVVNAKLAVGADGANSWVRETLGFETSERSYEQQAIIAVVQTEKTHQNKAWQVFLPSGPLALLPLSNPHQCAIVWSAFTKRADSLVQLEKSAFECELNNDFGSGLGEIKLLSTLKCFPLVARHVKTYVQPGVALVGDAAHTLHPLAGQGANLGFKDVAALVQNICLAREKKRSLGSLKSLRKFARARYADNQQMLYTMRAFSDLFTSSSMLSVQLRNQGLSFVDGCGWLKNYFKQEVDADKLKLPI